MMKISNRKAFIVGVRSIKLSKNEYLFIKKYKPWGIILFSRNIKSIKQAKKLTDSIKKIFNDPYYPILIDQEGGKVNRLKNIINTDFFNASFYGKLYEKSRSKCYLYYSLFIDNISHILNSIGVNINTVPVLDILRNKTSDVIGSRSFSKKETIIDKLGQLTIDRYHKNRIASVIKHIPGHGLGYVDSHYKMPIVKKELNYLLKKDFKLFMNKNSLFAMTAHILFEKIDAENTTTHSKKLIRIIRKKIKFKNIIISDDISMKELPYNLKTNALKAFTAGCDIVLHCNANLKEMRLIGDNSPKLNKFLINKTIKYYKLIGINN